MSRHLGRAFAVHWSEVDRWSPASFRDVAWSWPSDVIRPLSTALRRRIEVVDRNEHPLDSLTFGSLHFTGELSIRDMSSKLEVKGKLCFAHASDVVYSKIDARNGAIGIVPSTLPRVVFSSEYPIYEVVDSVALPDYVKLLFRMGSFRERINSLISGASGRKRVEPSTLESIEVPLPPLATQQAIVDHWQAAQKKNAAVLRAADEHEVGVTSELSKALGLGETAAPITRKAFAASWSQLQRWSLEYLRQSLADAAGEEQTHPVTTLGEVVADLANGWSPKCHPRPAEGDEWGVLKLGAVSFGQYNEAENKALPRELKPDAALEIKAGDILISRANITRLVGACAYVASTRPRLLLCDKIFRVVPLEQPKILPEFLAEMMKLPSVRQQIESLATGSSPTMKNITKPSLLSLRFPLPPLSIQKQLIAEVTAARAKIAAERAAVAKLAADTAREVEDMILGHRPVPNAT
jgi:type I restriction enzyme S subunit